jgi:hypothetical protein
MASFKRKGKRRKSMFVLESSGHLVVQKFTDTIQKKFFGFVKEERISHELTKD